MLINLSYWRRHNVSERAITFLRNHPDQVRYWDQDALNATVPQAWLELPVRWNAQIATIEDPAIVHFCGETKPWSWSTNHPLKDEYRQIRRLTPWPNYKPDGSPSKFLKMSNYMKKWVANIELLSSLSIR